MLAGEYGGLVSLDLREGLAGEYSGLSGTENGLSEEYCGLSGTKLEFNKDV